VFRRNFQRLIRLSLDGKNADQIVVIRDILSQAISTAIIGS
jgi:hypothetical protein